VCVTYPGAHLRTASDGWSGAAPARMRVVEIKFVLKSAGGFVLSWELI
jgi:hypothetical protein